MARTGLGLSLVPGQGVSWGLALQGLCLLEGGERWRGGWEGNPEWPHFWLPTAPSPPPSTSVFPLPKAAPNGSSDLRFYLTVYATIAGVNSLCTLLRAVLFAADTLRAAATLHRCLLGRVLMVRGRRVEVASTWAPSGGPSHHPVLRRNQLLSDGCST